MHVSVNIAESQVAAFVSSSAKPDSFHWLDCFNDLLDSVTEVTQGSGNPNGMALFWLFIMVEWLNVFWYPCELILFAHVLMVEQLKRAMFTSAKDSLTLSLVLHTIWVVDNTDSTLVFD